MSRIRNLITPGGVDPRVQTSILTPRSTILTAFAIMTYSGLILSIYDNIGFTPENSLFLVGSILTLIAISSVCLAALSSYIQYTHFTKPLLYLANAAREVSNGNYTVQLPPRYSKEHMDEIDVLYMDFNNMVKDLNSTEIMKSSFISNISHELKTPIAVISNYSALLENGNLTKEEQLEYISKIHSTSADLTTLITNILQISKLDNNQIQVKPETFNLSEELIQCILGFEVPLDAKNIDLEIDVPDNIEIESDSGLLKIAVNNIISNAIKFTPDDKKVSISLAETQSQISITISDEGCGMTEENIRHIFDKFYQADTSHATKGNGLGLAMVHKIINLLQGNITVTSELEKGSVFTITLPKKI